MQVRIGPEPGWSEGWLPIADAMKLMFRRSSSPPAPIDSLFLAPGRGGAGGGQ